MEKSLIEKLKEAIEVDPMSFLTVKEDFNGKSVAYLYNKPKHLMTDKELDIFHEMTQANQD
jgi:hypothetical protein